MFAGTSGIGMTETELALAQLLSGGEQNVIPIKPDLAMPSPAATYPLSAGSIGSRSKSCEPQPR